MRQHVNRNNVQIEWRSVKAVEGQARGSRCACGHRQMHSNKHRRHALAAAPAAAAAPHHHDRAGRVTTRTSQLCAVRTRVDHFARGRRVDAQHVGRRWQQHACVWEQTQTAGSWVRPRELGSAQTKRRGAGHAGTIPLQAGLHCARLPITHSTRNKRARRVSLNPISTVPTTSFCAIAAMPSSLICRTERTAPNTTHRIATDSTACMAESKQAQQCEADQQLKTAGRADACSKLQESARNRDGVRTHSRWLMASAPRSAPSSADLVGFSSSPASARMESITTTPT